MASLVNEGVWSVDELLEAYDEGLADGADPADGTQVLSEVARELYSEADAAKVRRHLEELQDRSASTDAPEPSG